MKSNYKYTIYSCYLGYIVQAIVVNINPILFATYMRIFHIPIDKISLLITMNFGVQFLVDIIAAKYVDKIGYRKSIVLAHIISLIGILGIGVLPNITGEPFIGLAAATIMSAVGGGLLEVLVSPIVEAAPGEEKEKAMSLLHSFYCWGCVGFILISTLMMKILGDGLWYIMPIIWTLFPLLNIFMFSVVPINAVTEEHEVIPFGQLAKQRIFWVFIVIMICSGAAEQAMSQWASYFAEIGLGVSKVVGDLLGPCAFCFLMGLSRTFYGKKGDTIKLEKFMVFSCVLCIASYLLVIFAPTNELSLIGCAICGLSVGIMWPGTFSLAVKKCRGGGTALFAILAFAGDLGCLSGPGIVGLVSGADSNLKAGMAAVLIFPILMIAMIKFIQNDR